MLLKTIKFDEKNPNWSKDGKYNALLLRLLEEHLNDTVRHRGYIYLNQICELLGDEWNPDDENPCIKHDGVDRIAFIQFGVFHESDNSLLVQIHCYD